MLIVTVDNNAPEFLSALQRLSRQLPYASALALTRTAQLAQAAETKEIDRVFDRPIERTRSGIYIKAATRDNPDAVVGIKDSWASGTAVDRYLFAEVEGGARADKRSERALKIRYPFLRGEWVPGPGVKLNAYGNVAAGTIQRILADVQAQNAAGYDAVRTARSLKRNKRYAIERYFVPPEGSPLDRIARGVWVRRGRKTEPALIFVPRTVYKRRFDFYGVGARIAAEAFPAEFRKALVQAFASAR